MRGGYGGIVGGARGAARRARSSAPVLLAESLGGVESLIEHPAIMTHASLPQALRDSLGISAGLIRLSVGVEDVEDLKGELREALR
jgi:cystathionine gamma-lyase